MRFWIRCDAYFSERPRFGPFWLRIEDATIAEIRDEPPTEQEAPNGVNEAQAGYVLPLLADTHAHVYMNPWPLAPSQRVKPGSGAVEKEIDDAAVRLKQALSKGIGLVRDMGDPLGINLAVKQRALGSDEAYPAYQVPGPAIHRPKKYGRFLGVKRETLDEIHALIDELAEQQAVDFIKIVSTGIVDFSTRQVKQAPQYTADELKAVVKHAEALGLKVASHCSGQAGIDLNIEGGIHFVEHAYFVRPDQQQRMLDAGQFWTPTFAPVYQQAANQECGWDDGSRRNLYRILTEHNDALSRGSAMEMKILAGTDAGSPGVSIGDGLFIELAALSRSLSTTEALRMATAANADACQHANYTGRIAPGQPASFALYAKAPWQDLGQLGRPIAVYQHGRHVSPPSQTSAQPEHELATLL